MRHGGEIEPRQILAFWADAAASVPTCQVYQVRAPQSLGLSSPHSSCPSNATNIPQTTVTQTRAIKYRRLWWQTGRMAGHYSSLGLSSVSSMSRVTPPDLDVSSCHITQSSHLQLSLLSLLYSNLRHLHDYQVSRTA